MSATVAAALKKIAVAILTNPKALKKVGMILLVILLVVFLPIGAIIALFNGQIDVNPNRLQAIVMENMSDEERARMEMRDAITAEIEAKMNDAGYDYTQKEKAKILYSMALYSYSGTDGFTDKLVGCFAADQTDAALIAAVNAAFGTSIDADEFTMVCDSMIKRIVYVAKDQLGNEGGEKFWSWYGFTERVEWCACFVSWCADQCGYIEAGTIPKFSGCMNGVDWFKEHERWLDASAMPSPGMIIFFDWDHKGNAGDQDGDADHVGIVEKVENGIVYTIEGNSGDACKQNQYAVNHYEILGYGTYN